jgi:uncharacterized iron-regulated protein
MFQDLYHKSLSAAIVGPLRAGLLTGLLAALLTGGCAVPQKMLQLPTEERRFAQGAIIDTASAEPIGFEDLIDQLSRASVVFVGERHTSEEDHEIQLRILTALVARGDRVKVGMEMFDHTYQSVLDQWSMGQLETQRFLELTHWYANWRYDYDLYRPILDYVQKNRLPLIGLNLPFHLPPKISTGGIDSLRPAERALVAADIDTGDADHRAYLKGVFDQHHLKGRENFEYFYMAQCAWEDTMADQIAMHLGDEDLMVVIIGNGHIQKKYGVPKRTDRRTGKPSLTVYTAPAGSEADRGDADFIWVTAPLPPHPMPKMKP